MYFLKKKTNETKITIPTTKKKIKLNKKASNLTTKLFIILKLIISHFFTTKLIKIQLNKKNTNTDVQQHIHTFFLQLHNNNIPLFKLNNNKFKHKKYSS
jgi:hypothetical protein